MLRGRCACEAVGYEVADEFVVAYNCHCSNCRAWTGSAFMPWGEVKRDKFMVTKGRDSLTLLGDADAIYEAHCAECLLARLLDRTRSRACADPVWNADRRAYFEADRAHVRRLEGSVV
jgi:hypothetical protein